MSESTCANKSCGRAVSAKSLCARCYKRQWRKDNPERAKAHSRRQSQTSKFRTDQRERKRAWRANNPELNAELRRLYKRRRKARDAGVFQLPYNLQQLKERLSMFPGCWMCGSEPDTVDHVKPISVGGADILANLRPACMSCNASKRSRWPFDTGLRHVHRRETRPASS